MNFPEARIQGNLANVSAALQNNRTKQSAKATRTAGAAKTDESFRRPTTANPIASVSKPDLHESLPV